MLPPSLKVLSITSPNDPLEPDLIGNDTLPTTLALTQIENVLVGFVHLAREKIRKFGADIEWQSQKWKRCSRQLAIAEGAAIQEALERFQHVN